MIVKRILWKSCKSFGNSIRSLTNDLSDNNLFDTFGRKHNYLRISLTERCNLRCLYCMPEKGITLTKNDKLLSASELKRITNLFVRRLGVDKIRLTGGEPLIRKDIFDVVSDLSDLRAHGLKTIAITTNGLVLDNKCRQLRQLGVNGLNISLDTLIPEKFETITRRKGWHKVMNSIDTALSSGFDSIKLNCVVIKGLNDDEVLDFVELTRHKSLDVRFIEYMPFDGNKWKSEKFVPFERMLDQIKDKYQNLQPIEPKMNDTSKGYKVKSFSGQIGFITSMSDNFCSTCNRIRITADGNLKVSRAVITFVDDNSSKVCLFGKEEVSLRDAIRSGADDQRLVEIIRIALNKKRKQHSAQQMRNYCTYPEFTHLDNESGRPKMVDIADKPMTDRTARAEARVWVGPQVCQLIQTNLLAKGNALSVAQIAGIMAAKKTSELIPLCHQIPLQNVSIECTIDEANSEIVIESSVRTTYQTGVEMEALTAVSVSALTVYDMCKAVNHSIVIKHIRLVEKTGGKRHFISE